MDQDLEVLWRKFSLTEDEQDVVELETPKQPDNSVAKYKRCVVGRLLSGKPFNAKALHKAMTGAWRVNGSFDVTDIGKGMFICEFKNVWDRNKVLREAPWHYDRQLIVLSEIKGDEQPSTMKLNNSPFWVRLCNIPLNCRDRDSVLRIGERVGPVMEVREEDLESWGKHVRVRIMVDITRPLKRGVMVRNNRGEKVWVFFRFEKLPNYCYWCGMLGHIHDDCEIMPEDIEAKDWPYSPALRASPFKRAVVSRSSSEREKYTSETDNEVGDTGPPTRRTLDMDEEGVVMGAIAKLDLGPANGRSIAVEGSSGNALGDAEEENSGTGVSAGSNEISSKLPQVVTSTREGIGGGGAAPTGKKNRGRANLKTVKAAARRGSHSKGNSSGKTEKKVVGDKRKLGLQLIDEPEDVVMEELCLKKVKLQLAGPTHELVLAETAEQSRCPL
ncbi:uncharacterized protein LOC126668590 [Mercurialis annua]|uniref:uncharacterized protein LOC126668590 n=1 Tax=Mercurialis annua TaxID=3986 RepID=UPI00215E77FA|nr:uncharacterized protein LOC126668590 [Mercurialis annua]